MTRGEIGAHAESVGVRGKRLGRYEVVRHLANGGMAEVLIARATGEQGFEHHVVLKRIRGEQAKDQRFVDMFLDEARLAAALHHQHVVKVHDIGQEDGEFFFAMEYVHGEDARKLLMELAKKQEKLPLEHVLTIVTAALAGLHCAHTHTLKIVHRDVSPANILVGFDGGVKVADFGIAKAALRTQETRSGTLKGKVSYMSPEQVTGGVIDARSDVFAMGIVLYELSTVRRLFKAENDFMTMTAIVQGGVPPPSTVRPDLPPALEAIIMKALSLAPDRRYQSAEEMRLALEQFATEAGIRGSAAKLGAFMKRVFGSRIEPWFSPDEEATESLSIDFDGDGEGVAHTNVTAVPLAVHQYRRSSPIAIVHATTEAESPEAVPREPSSNWNLPPTETPIAWSPETQQVHIGRRNWLLAAIGGVAIAAVLLIVVIARSGGSDDEPATTAGQPAPPPAPPKIEAPPPAPPPPPAPEPAPEPVAVPAPVDPPVAASPPPVKVKRQRTRPQPKSTPKWDPTKLFPNQKK